MSKDDKSTYYDKGGIETIEIIKAKLPPEQYRGYLLGNMIKYLCRLNWKHENSLDQIRDLEKAIIYANLLKTEMEQTGAIRDMKHETFASMDYRPGQDSELV